MDILLYFYHTKSSFVKKDLEIFTTKYQVIEDSFKIKNRFSVFTLLIKQLYFLIQYVNKAKVIVIQFSGYHSLLPTLFGKLFNKPVLIIPGGIDCVSFPEFGYGNFTKTILAKFTCLSYRLASHIAPVHERLVHSSYTYASFSNKEQGYKVYCPTVTTPFTTIYNGFDSETFYRTQTIRNKNSFITVATSLSSEFRQKLKGIDLILEAAKRLPHFSFTILGIKDSVFPTASKNVTLIPPIGNSKLPEVFSSHEFYLQLSLSEGFPNALCEAMLCECVPVGSQVSSIPEIISDTGFILKKNDTNLLVDLLQTAVQSDTLVLGKNARNRIVENYNIERRKVALLNLLKEIQLG